MHPSKFATLAFVLGGKDGQWSDYPEMFGRIVMKFTGSFSTHSGGQVHIIQGGEAVMDKDYHLNQEFGGVFLVVSNVTNHRMFRAWTKQRIGRANYSIIDLGTVKPSRRKPYSNVRALLNLALSRMKTGEGVL